MQNILLLSVCSIMNVIFIISILMTTLSTKLSKEKHYLIWIISTSILFGFSICYFNLYKQFNIFIYLELLLIYTVVISIISIIIYNEVFECKLFTIFTASLIIIITSIFLYSISYHWLISSGDTDIYIIILLYTMAQCILFIAIANLYDKHIKNTIQNMFEYVDSQIKYYVLVPILAYFSFMIITFILMYLSITPDTLYFVSIVFILFVIYVSEYIVLYKSCYLIIQANKYKYIVNNDIMTGLLNRFAFEQYELKLNEEISKNTAKFLLVIIDLNFLKKLNDTYGHDKGDIALKIVADDIKSIYNGCTCFRIGGDEFAVIITGKNVDTYKFLLSTIGSSIIKNDKENEWENISAACGYAEYDKQVDKSFDDVFRRADAEMYKQKQSMKAVRTS